MVIVAVIILLVGVCIWGVLGHLDTTITTAAIVEDKALTIYIPEEDISSVLNKNFTIEGTEYEINASSIPLEPIAVSGEDFSEYLLHISILKLGDWVYAVKCNTGLTDGIYKAQIVLDSTSPISFIFN